MIRYLSVTCCAVFAAGCSADTADESVGTAADSIIGGTATFARPEVGVFWNPAGLCTATLISDRHFLTAAHCIDDVPIVRAPTRMTFEIDRTTGRLPAYSVDRVFSLRHKHGVGWDDLAVGRLTSPVPSAAA